jgi:hypothetical protein
MLTSRVAFSTEVCHIEGAILIMLRKLQSHSLAPASGPSALPPPQ